MKNTNQVYVKLQKHLDNQAVGFPATRSGAEIKILKYIFTPDEAEIACCLSYKFEPLETIIRRAGHLVDSAEELERHFDRIQQKGGIESKIKHGQMLYCNAPLVVGMYEFQQNRLTPEFIEDFNDYTSDKNFGLAFLSTKLPQMRTIPVSKSIQPQHKVSTFDEVMTLLQQAEEPFGIIECICRKKKSIEGHSCKVTDRKETCLAVGSIARMVLRSVLSLTLLGSALGLAGAFALARLLRSLLYGISPTDPFAFVAAATTLLCAALAASYLPAHRASRTDPAKMLRVE